MSTPTSSEKTHGIGFETNTIPMKDAESNHRNTYILNRLGKVKSHIYIFTYIFGMAAD